MAQALDVLREHVDRFNNAVASGDFGPMLELFTDDASLEFEGVPAGPFHGKPAIEEAYRRQPPDDQIDILEASENTDGVTAAYAWRQDEGARAGEMRLSLEGERISRLVVTFDQPPG